VDDEQDRQCGLAIDRVRLAANEQGEDLKLKAADLQE
jgi:hypothetical protein